MTKPPEGGFRLARGRLVLMRLGYWSPAVNMHSIQRMSAVDTAVSAEMLVIDKMFVNQQRLRIRKHAEVNWQQPNGKWKVNLVFI